MLDERLTEASARSLSSLSLLSRKLEGIGRGGGGGGEEGRGELNDLDTLSSSVCPTTGVLEVCELKILCLF